MNSIKVYLTPINMYHVTFTITHQPFIDHIPLQSNHTIAEASHSSSPKLLNHQVSRCYQSFQTSNHKNRDPIKHPFHLPTNSPSFPPPLLSPIPIPSIPLVTAQTLHPSPTRSLSSRAVVTLGPTVWEVVACDNSSIGVVGLGVWVGEWDCEAEFDCDGEGGWTCDRWKTWPQAKPIRISFSTSG